MGMVVATEELSWGSLGVGGSLITRPEILTRALVYGGTEEQKKQWLPKLASAEVLAAVAVTEPDYGSDVAGIVTSATPGRRRVGRQRRQDVVHVRGTGRRADAAGADRPGPVAGASRDLDVHRREAARRRARLPLHAGRRDVAGRPADLAPGRLEGRPIDTLGYRGMHSYELAFENWFVPAANLVGGEEGLGKGFYLQMEGFENGRLQTAARALGVMQAAYEAAVAYARERRSSARRSSTTS